MPISHLTSCIDRFLNTLSTFYLVCSFISEQTTICASRFDGHHWDSYNTSSTFLGRTVSGDSRDISITLGDFEMQGVNKVIVMGRLGQDPEVRMTPNGQHVCTMSLATSESWMKDGNKEEKTEWHRVVLWGKTAELAGKYLKKGRPVYIEGKLQTRSWNDKDGQKRYTTEIVGNSMQFIDSSNSKGSDGPDIPPPDSYDGGYQSGGSGQSSGGGYDSPAPRGNQNSYKPVDLDDDVPF